MSNLTLSLIQTDLRWESKETNLHLLGKKVASLKGTTELVLLPEMFTTGFSMNPSKLAEGMDGETVSWMRSTAAENRVILGGSVIIEDNGRYFNRFIWMLPNGEYGYYDKRHLFAYSGEDKHYVAGNKRLIASVKGWKLNLNICYDLRFPVWSRQTPGANPEFDVLVYVANWPDKRIHAWKTLLCARAIENQCYVIGVNRVGTDGNEIYYSGNSLVINPLGEVLYHVEDEEDIFTITLDRHLLEDTRLRFPFLKDADSFRISDL
jgi:predicted amidohydrolase